MPPISSSEDAQKRLEIIASRLTTPLAAKKMQEDLRNAATYTNPNLPSFVVENDRGGRYVGVFSDLVGQYYATRDPEVLAVAKQVRDFIKEKYPATYQAFQQEGVWDIKEGK